MRISQVVVLRSKEGTVISILNMKIESCVIITYTVRYGGKNRQIQIHEQISHFPLFPVAQYYISAQTVREKVSERPALLP